MIKAQFVAKMLFLQFIFLYNFCYPYASAEHGFACGYLHACMHVFVYMHVLCVCVCSLWV